MIFSRSQQLWLLIVALFVVGLSAGLMIPGSLNATLSCLNSRNKGVGIGAFFTNGFLGGSLGVAISGSFINLITHKRLFFELSADNIHVSQSKLETIKNISNGSRPLQELFSVLPHSQAQYLFKILKSNYFDSFCYAMLLIVFLSIIALYLCRYLKSNTVERV